MAIWRSRVQSLPLGSSFRFGALYLIGNEALLLANGIHRHPFLPRFFPEFACLSKFRAWLFVIINNGIPDGNQPFSKSGVHARHLSRSTGTVKGVQSQRMKRHRQDTRDIIIGGLLVWLLMIALAVSRWLLTK